jgi:uncharacterized protein involved in exopolysaccharide biosynthesis
MTDNNLENKKNDEIDLIEVAKNIWSERKLIYKITAVFFILSIIFAVGTPKEFKSETILLVETGGTSSVNGLLQQFGGLAGLSLGGTQNGDNLSPEIFPQIIHSTPFLVEIMAEKIHSSKLDSSITVYEYLSTQIKPSVMDVFLNYTIGLPRKIISLFDKKEQPDYTLPELINVPLNLTGQQCAIMGALASRVKVESGEINGTIKISAEMPDPLSSAELTNLVFKYLSKYMIEYRIQKVKTDLDFITKQNAEAKQRYFEAQQKLAYFRDANRNVSLASSRTEEERLQNENTLAFNVYNGLSQQLEQSKLKVQEKTPVFKVIDPAKVPLNNFKPNRSLILFALTFFGVILGIGIVIGKLIIFSILKIDNI